MNRRSFEIPFLLIELLELKANSVGALLACGADPDVSNWRDGTSARDLARQEWLRRPRPAYRRIVELMGLDADALLAERETLPVPEPTMPPRMPPRMPDYLALASDDARRLGDTSIGLEHFFFGMLWMMCAKSPARIAARTLMRRVHDSSILTLPVLLLFARPRSHTNPSVHPFATAGPRSPPPRTLAQPLSISCQ